MHEKLIQTIAQKVPFSKDDVSLCEKYFESISFPKNQIIE